MCPNSNRQDASVTSAGNNTNDQGTTGRAASAGEKLNDLEEICAGKEQGTGKEHGSGNAHGFINEHDKRSTRPKHDEQAESHGLFTSGELAEALRVLFNKGKIDIFRCSLTSGKLDQVIQTLLFTYDLTSPLNMDYIDTPTGKIPRHYELEMLLKQWCAKAEFGFWNYYYPNYIAYQSKYDNGNFGGELETVGDGGKDDAGF
ncbi:uncharacterized protein PGTG_19110 [Puccinia graminis f. sp. tritici CRL 75-36-700-3]|uniref:Uncharacterized protein n=1 Tax=Puccinia graminis f. sp. tritici (strain CRL 75-36-700-3 / race SCCL) TaxID=418459 RepID=E3L9Y1_PUCGT|nr:uncharacterized protein PGTG_19089 [Puccinia graminis f. sp. tritici CRL 75-36-700-3]XP_003337785.2 uncharacterized protein PGTG_19099 [Puccinia graminis f. sp. tritici CRL 75-36-700-3]XP_003337796.2 uncharacterized protein PGTG_19110 [Puccinia graminis f. sp. tritici CRL 75-36-700-3]EFP93356.2 hypothetical protein PGTG_19089 [Puccinia graminis f. sp. tritici CRL 75-36-700-3]EFP93366.2 hypothetical protein PGTG_19099 [Puccinia graminis f. sp. tritici CRL 75-36-700-3]EFP93377.2 hypothetical 